MFRSRFFWKLYISYAALVILTSLVIGMLVHGRMRQTLVDRLEASLRNETLILAPYAAEAFGGDVLTDVREEITRLGRETTMRITLIEPSGEVLADSDEDPSRMENHLGRPEVKASFDRPFGIERRYSKTLDTSMLYVAHSMYRDDELVGIVRVSLPLDDVSAQLASMRGRILVGGGIGALVALVMGLFVASRITAPITDMNRAAEALRGGQYDRRIENLPHDEIGALGEALNRLGEEVTQRIATISKDDAQLRAVLAGMVDSVIAVDDSDCVVFMNRAAGRLLGMSTGEAEGRRLWELIRLVELEELLREARAGDRAVHCELDLDRDSTDVRLQAFATSFRAGDTGGVVIVLHDVSELRRLERVRRDFVANVSHELKTPLTSIRGYVETLLDGALHDEKNNRRFLEKIEENVGRLTHLVADLLSLGRIEAQDKGPELVAVDWRPILEGTLRRSEGAAKAKQIRCELALPAEKLSVIGDAESMIQVAENLVDNAIKYTPGAGQVTLGLARDGDEAVLEVRDTGLGIPADDVDRIFERFYRVDKARSREVGGTGLGLAIVKHLVGAMQGEVTVESELGRGTSFRVRLPLAG